MFTEEVGLCTKVKVSLQVKEYVRPHLKPKRPVLFLDGEQGTRQTTKYNYLTSRLFKMGSAHCNCLNTGKLRVCN